MIEAFSETDWDKALRYFRNYKDQQTDLTDCLSFVIMDRLDIKTASLLIVISIPMDLIYKLEMKVLKRLKMP